LGLQEREEFSEKGPNFSTMSKTFFQGWRTILEGSVLLLPFTTGLLVHQVSDEKRSSVKIL